MCYNYYVNFYQACTGWSITLANMSASTTYFMYAFLKILIVG